MRHRFDYRAQSMAVWGIVSSLLFALPAAYSLEPPASVAGSPGVSDDAALNAIFGEAVLGQNARHVVVKSRELPPEKRYADLSRWVLPHHGHGCRIDGTIQRLPPHDVDVADPSVMRIADYPEAHWILCPAWELVRLARELGQLDAVREQVLQQASAAIDQGDSRTTLLTLIDVAANERERVAEQLAERFRETRDEAVTGAAQQWWSDLIVLWAAMENPATADLVIEDYFGVFDLRMYKPDPRLDVIADYLCLLLRTCSIKPTHPNPQHDLGTAMFDVFSYVDAKLHARGNPLPRFYFDDRGAVKLSGLERDYLALRSPLTGEFEVIGEVATHTGAFTELVVDGLAVKPTSDLQQVSMGSFARGSWQQAISPPMQPVGTRCRIRAKSTAGKTTHYWNSRETYVDPSGESTAPWVAARSWRRTHSAISKLAWAGSPTIPDSFGLVGGPALRGWASYYDSESNGGLGDWTASTEQGHWTLASGDSSSPRGCCEEDLLYYVRPLTWDATVSYDFEYRPGSCEVHPCLGRSVFLIRPDGVYLHRLTDGRHDASEMRADNSRRITGDDGSVIRPSLKEGWNRAELRIESDRVNLWVNGDRIGTHPIASGESRTFGFFHYRDQARARIRNVHLAGDWPRELPTLQNQPLAWHQIASWDAAAGELAASWSHDFRHGIPPRYFFLDGAPALATQLPEGVRIHRMSSTPALHLNFLGEIRGDFDIVMEFQDLSTSDKKPTWHNGVGLDVTVENAHRDRIDVVRRVDRLNRHQHIVLARNVVNRFGGVDWVKDTSYIDESVAGRLRLVRQGNVIYGLYADGDSNSFRYLGEETVDAGVIAPQGLRLHTVTGRDMPIAVTLVRLEIRADAIDLPIDPPPAVQAVERSAPAQPTLESMPTRLYESFRGLFP
ncbi:MAG: DUF1583 domain-containing protein [Planctomycetaceae bacterium]